MAIDLDELAGYDGGEKSHRLALHWLDQIHTVKDNAEHKRWIKRGESIEKRYRDERNRTDEEGQRRYNALWSNVEILKPALYGKMPLPVAERRFKDKDPVGRNAAEILERALRNEIEICGFDEALQQAVSDYLLPGRGTVWVRYEPVIAESVSLPLDSQTDLRDSQGNILTGDQPEAGGPESRREEGQEQESGRYSPEPGEKGAETPEPEPETEKELESEKLKSTGDRIVRESTPVDFVNWADFFTFPVRARVWREVTAIAKRVYMSREQMMARFGKEIGKAIPLQKDDRGQRTQNTTLQSLNEDKGQVYEVWDKDSQAVYWVAEGYEYLCDRKDDPLNLEDFFPTPKPLFANPTNTTLVPVPDFIQYQDQALQIDELTQRIAMLAKVVKAGGVYNAAAKDIQRLFSESVENELIPVDDWAAFAEKGGIEGNISLIPVADFINVLNELMRVKDMQIQEMDRLTGITDIMRGTTDARETLGGQRLKSNSAGTRLTRRQNEVARFARDVVRIMADIMCQHFSPQTLIETSGALYEEGLGPDDMPPLTQLLSPSAPPQQQQQPAPGLSPPQQTQQPQPQAQSQPPLPTGGNVVPFRPPQLAAGAPNQAGPPPVASAQPGAPAAPQTPPWQIITKMQAVQRIGAALQLLRNERVRGFRVDIEVDSTIYPDAAQEKQDRTQFIAGVTQFLQQAMALGAQLPVSIPLMSKLLQFGVRGYRVGRDLELAIEQFAEAATQEAQQRLMMAQSQPNPLQAKLQIEAQKAQGQLQQQKNQIQTEQMRAQADVASEKIKAQSQREQSAAEVQRQQIENQGEQANAQADIMAKQMDIRMRQMEMAIESMRMQMESHKLQREQAKPIGQPNGGGEQPTEGQL